MASRQLAWNDELVVAEPAVGGLNDMLRGAQFLFGIRIDTGVRSGKIPDAGEMPGRLA